ncbi:MAG: putative tellurium resistance membrane protein TerC [Cryomorphaceae bacterium]|jgi:predicted tellurium resistance membrane protein TerC
MEFNIAALLAPENLVALGTLTVLEIVLGVDNILFISIISEKLPKEQQPRARVVGLALALIFRLALLFVISWLVHFTEPIFTLFEIDFSGRDLILLGGGFFLLVKTISEIHNKVEGDEEGHGPKAKPRTFLSVIGMIILVDMVFSFDSILTAVGMVDELSIMVAAVVLAMIVMLVFVNKISRIINSHPGIQMLALSFLILISFVLILDGLHQHIERGFVYFALFFSLIVEALNIRSQNNRKKAQTK